MTAAEEAKAVALVNEFGSAGEIATFAKIGRLQLKASSIQKQIEGLRKKQEAANLKTEADIQALETLRAAAEAELRAAAAGA